MVAKRFFLLLLLLPRTLQAADLLDKELTLHVRSLPLKEVFDEINRQTSLRFSYSPQVVDVSQPVSLDVQNRPAREVLDALLGSQYEYKLTRKFAILRKNQITIAAAEALPDAASERDTTRYAYITNQRYVKNLCLSDSGIVACDCLTSTNIKNLEVMNRHLTTHLAAIMLATAAANASAQATQPASIAQQLSKASKSFATLVVDAADETTQAVKVLAEEIGKQVAQPAPAPAPAPDSAAAPAPAPQPAPDSAPAPEPEPAPVPASPANPVAAAPDSVRPFLITIFPPFSYPDLHAEKNMYNVSLNVLFGLNGGVTGLELGYIANMSRYRMSGVQVVGIVNLGFGQVSGVQIAGIGNLAAKDTVKAQLAGIANVAQSAKFQAAGIANLAYQNSKVQLAGIANLSVTDTSLLQAAGIANAARRANMQLAGIANSSVQANVQIAGIANFSTGKNRLQVAGIANAADTSSCQIGLVNAARKASVQVGLVNVCDTSDGVMIGLVNVARKGGLYELEISSGLNADLNVAYRMGTPKFYTFAELSHVFADGLWRYGFGVGTQVSFGSGWGLNIEGLNQTVVKSDWLSRSASNNLSQLRVLGYKRFAKHFAVFAGPAFYVYNTRIGQRGTIDLPTPYTIYSGQNSGVATKTWVGFSAGIRI